MNILKNAARSFIINTDQVEVVAGRSHPEYKGGELISPIYVLLVGRATKEFKKYKNSHRYQAMRENYKELLENHSS